MRTLTPPGTIVAGIWALALTACWGPGTSGVPLPEDPAALERARVLTRISLDLRGKRPSPDDLSRAKHDPAALDALAEGYLHDPAFGARVRDLFAVAYRTRYEAYMHPFEEEIGDDDAAMIAYQAAVAEEPLKLIEHIATRDLPYTRLIDADYTFVDATLAQIWPVRGYREEVGGWQKVRYRDGRPAAGVLATNALYFRYLSSEVNLNRGRANAVSRILLCDNYLQRPIDFPRNIDLTDEEGIHNAIRENAACVSCHVTLDPMASYFFGFDGRGDDPTPVYNAELEAYWRELPHGQAPAYLGQPGDTVADLGAQLAQDPRFVTCATRRVYEGLLGRPATSSDADALRRHADAFRDGGLTLRALVRSILADPVYRGGDDGARPNGARKLMSPEILSDAVADLTGYRMAAAGHDLLRSDRIGLHILGGGLSADSGDFPPTTSNVTRALVQARVADAAAAAVMDDPERVRALFGDTNLDADTPSPDAAVALYRAVLGLELYPAHAEIQETLTLWHELVERAELTPRQAWSGTLAVLLRDPRFVMY